MTVISLRRRRTDSLDEYRRAKRSASSLVYAVRRDIAGNAIPLVHDEVEIEVTVGAKWAETLGGGAAKFFATGTAPIRIPPYGSVVVEVAEELALPFNVLGIVFPKGSLFREKGLHPLTAKIDPTWSGRLRLLLRNSTDSSREIRQGQPIATIVFFSMDVTLEREQVFKDADLPVVKRTKLRQLRDFLDRPPVYTIMGAIIAAMVTAVITTALAN